jgi:diamine N-acetyltransferase
MSVSDAASLREITADTVRMITSLAVHPGQERFVAPNSESLSQALFSEEAWYRAIYNGERPVGFVMLYDETLRASPPSAPKVVLWRFMIDAAFQGKGLGSAGLQLVIAHVRNKKSCTQFLTSCVPGEGSPEEFYLRHGFERTGEVDEGEDVLELKL